MIWSRIGSGPIATIGFGRNSVISLSRVPRPPHRMKTGIPAIFNGVTHRHIGPAADRPRLRVLSQTRRRRKNARPGIAWAVKGRGPTMPDPGYPAALVRSLTRAIVADVP